MAKVKKAAISRTYVEELHQINNVPVRVLRASDGTYWINMLDAEELSQVQNGGNPTIYCNGGDAVN